MLVDIETFFLNTLVNTQTANLLDTPEEDYTCDCSPNINTEDTEALCTEETEATAIESTTVEGEETSHQCTEDTTYTMYRTCTYRVINMKFGIDKLDREYQNDTSQETDDGRTQWANQVATCCNGYQTSQDTIQCQ